MNQRVTVLWVLSYAGMQGGAWAGNEGGGNSIRWTLGAVSPPGQVWAAEVCSRMSCSVAVTFGANVPWKFWEPCLPQALTEGIARPDGVPAVPTLVSKPKDSKFLSQSWSSQALTVCGGSLGVDPLVCGPLPQRSDE